MQVKILEIRDRGTFIPVLAISLTADNPEQSYYLGRCGYPRLDKQVMVTNLNGETTATADPYFWCDRTWATAHKYILDHFSELKDGGVVDVEFILGETTEPKTSERFE